MNDNKASAFSPIRQRVICLQGMLKRMAVILLLLAVAFGMASCKDGQDEIDLAPLRELMEVTYEESEYTPSSYKRYINALNAAQEFLDTEPKTQYDYKTVQRELAAAITLLNKKPDKTVLAEKIAKAEEYEEHIDSYYNASATRFITALGTARKHLEDENTTQGLVDMAVKGLSEAIEGLQVRADKSELIALIASASGIARDEYMNTDWTDFDKALSDAARIAEKESATKAEISTAHTVLTAAVDALVRNPDKTELQVLYDEAAAIDASLYSKATLAALDYAKAAAWDALYIARVDQARIDEIEAELTAALNGLQYKVTSTYTLTCTATMIYNNNVGDQWGYYTTVNGYDFSKKHTFVEEVGITLRIEATVYESDSVTDWGSTFFDLVMTDGYTTSVEITVRENRGTYAGNKAKWRMTYTVTEVVE